MLLSAEHWERVLQEAVPLGNETQQISGLEQLPGGQPTNKGMHPESGVHEASGPASSWYPSLFRFSKRAQPAASEHAVAAIRIVACDARSLCRIKTCSSR
jgi:hypothetical protein